MLKLTVEIEIPDIVAQAAGSRTKIKAAASTHAKDGSEIYKSEYLEERSFEDFSSLWLSAGEGIQREVNANIEHFKKYGS